MCKKRKKTVPVFLLILFVLINITIAKTVWIAEHARGNGDGRDRHNAHSIEWFNDAANWGGESTTINPGDTVMLSGTITTAATIQGSGADRSPITILFDHDAVLRSDAWTSTGALTAKGISYVIIDGGNEGSAIESGDKYWNTNIESTDNGESLGNQVTNPRLIYIIAANNVLVKNMKVVNGYVRDSASTDSRDGGTGIFVHGTGNLKIRNNFVKHSETGIQMKGAGNRVEGLLVDSNNISHVSNGIYFVCAAPNDTILGGYITNNRLNNFSHWTGGPHHNDGIQTISSQPGCLITGLHVAYNHIGPDAGKDGDTNAWIFLEDNVNRCYIYNNLLTVNEGDVLSNGCITAGRNRSSWSIGDTTGIIAFNTIICGNQNTGISASYMDIIGNIVYKATTYTSTYSSMQEDITVAYNVYYNTEGNTKRWWDKELGHYKSLETWQAAGWDSTSVFEDPKLVGYKLSDSSPFKSFVFPQAFFEGKVDKDGNPRPRGSNWSPGCYQNSVVSKAEGLFFMLDTKK